MRNLASLTCKSSKKRNRNMIAEKASIQKIPAKSGEGVQLILSKFRCDILVVRLFNKVTRRHEGLILLKIKLNLDMVF